MLPEFCCASKVDGATSAHNTMHREDNLFHLSSSFEKKHSLTFGLAESAEGFYRRRRGRSTLCQCKLGCGV